MSDDERVAKLEREVERLTTAVLNLSQALRIHGSHPLVSFPPPTSYPIPVYKPVRPPGTNTNPHEPTYILD